MVRKERCRLCGEEYEWEWDNDHWLFCKGTQKFWDNLGKEEKLIEKKEQKSRE